MGNVDSRSMFDQGHLMIQTDQPHYSPGEVVTGKIYMRLTGTVQDATDFVMSLWGMEEGRWLDVVYKQVRRGDHYETVREEVWREAKHHIINQEFHVYRFPNPVLMPGDYMVPFQFTLPYGIPASIFYRNDNLSKKPYGKIKYSVQVKLARYGTFTRDIRYKQVLLVREAPRDFAAMINQKSEYQMTTWCCIKQGKSGIQGRFEKNMYFPNEEVKADAIISN